MLKPGNRVSGTSAGREFTGEVYGVSIIDDKPAAVYVKLDKPIVNPEGHSIHRIGITGDTINELTEL